MYSCKVSHVSTPSFARSPPKKALSSRTTKLTSSDIDTQFADLYSALRWAWFGEDDCPKCQKQLALRIQFLATFHRDGGAQRAFTTHTHTHTHTLTSPSDNHASALKSQHYFKVNIKKAAL